MSVIITRLSTDDEIEQLLKLQHKNLARNNSPQTIESQGFVTVEHTFDLLKQMNQAEPQIVARDGEKIVGYALVMLKEFRQSIPVLEPMFAMLSEIYLSNKVLSDYHYYVMGQICIDEQYRGQGLFDQLYLGQKEQLKDRYELCITEVATRNQRSMNAHRRVGFESIHEYTAPNGETWSVVVWDIRK
ncbi:GNAT family N-acetyltransferase [Cytophagaceae bacterium DM2B3-1]|uniref:GNAT family N-acetyltransferase n=1 Tax=Xanthocytophaga flava TaxID=3048013 RepID=A0ABT7CRV7_9BACT|nr:GNAT family N-acetyltransferase [Xanthocytophaga flavus]MDJ1496421.1 GNAT family N-acetyltransferase [Xanthocytophaga flavus]